MQKLYTIEYSVSVESGSVDALKRWLDQFGIATLLCIDNPDGGVPSASFKLQTSTPARFMGSVEKAYREYDAKLEGIYFYTSIYELTHCPEDLAVTDILGLINNQAYTSCITRNEINYLIGQLEGFKADVMLQINNQTRNYKKSLEGINKLGQEVFGQDLFNISTNELPSEDEEQSPSPEKKQWLH